MWRDEAHLLDMLLYAQKARGMNTGTTFESFLADETRQLATLHVLQILGESAAKVSVAFRQAHPEIPWERIVGCGTASYTTIRESSFQRSGTS